MFELLDVVALPRLDCLAGKVAEQPVPVWRRLARVVRGAPALPLVGCFEPHRFEEVVSVRRMNETVEAVALGGDRLQLRAQAGDDRKTGQQVRRRMRCISVSVSSPVDGTLDQDVIVAAVSAELRVARDPCPDDVPRFVAIVRGVGPCHLGDVEIATATRTPDVAVSEGLGEPWEIVISVAHSCP